MNSVELAVFMGCSTAADYYTDNLPKFAIQKGAKVAIGWAVPIPLIDTYDWTNRFFSKLSDGFTVIESVNYANSFIYSSSEIKNTRIYGLENTTINLSDGSSYSTKNINLKEYNFNTKILLSNLNVNEKKLLVGDVIKSSIDNDFISDDYTFEVSNNNFGKIYDYYLTINGIKTKLGYTVFLNKEETKVLSIIDNMKNINIIDTKINNQSRIKSTMDNLLVKQIEKVKNEIFSFTSELDSSTLTRSIINEYKYFNVEDDKLYHIIQVKEIDKIFDTTSIIDYKVEIK